MHCDQSGCLVDSFWRQRGRWAPLKVGRIELGLAAVTFPAEVPMSQKQFLWKSMDMSLFEACFSFHSFARDSVFCLKRQVRAGCRCEARVILWDFKEARNLYVPRPHPMSRHNDSKHLCNGASLSASLYHSSPDSHV